MAQARPADAEANADIAPAAVGGGLLERSLQVDTEAAQRNVELLLETREADAPMASRSRSTAGPAPAPGATAAVSAHGLQVPDGSAAAVAASAPAGRAALAGLVAWLRDHRAWLLGALGLVVVAAVAGPLWQHRRVHTTEQQLRRLETPHRSSRGRRHATRR